MSKIKICYVAFCCDSNLVVETVKQKCPGSEVHVLDTSRTPHQIEDDIIMAMLGPDMLCPLKLAFVGGNLAKQLAEQWYRAAWIKDSATTAEDLLHFWTTILPDEEWFRHLNDGE
jgi:hypothetical protein